MKGSAINQVNKKTDNPCGSALLKERRTDVPRVVVKMTVSKGSGLLVVLFVMLLIAPLSQFWTSIGLNTVEIRRVGPDREYKMISDALEDGTSNMIIEVDPGTYRESIVLKSQVELRGSGGEKPVLEPYGPGPIIETMADGCIIKDLEIRPGQGSGEGVRLSSDENSVSGCVISATGNALVLNGSNGNTIFDNSFIGMPSLPDDPSHPRFASPVGHWKLDGPLWQGTSGEVKDISGYGSHGTAKGDTACVQGKDGNGARFDGDEDNIRIDYANVLNIAGPGLSMEAWVKIDDMRERQIILDKEESYEFMISRGNISWAIMTVQKDWYWVHTGVKIPLGAWVHVAVTYDSSNVRTYVDHLLAHTQSYPYGNVKPSGLPFTIGSGYKWYTGWKYTWFTRGCIDEVKVYEVCINYSTPFAEREPFASGVFLNGSDGNTFRRNTVQKFEGHGMVFESSDDNSIIENVFQNNDKRAILIDSVSTYNVVTLNDLNGNNGGSDQGWDDGVSNLWDTNGMGNFWSDWTMPDSDSDLIVDDPYPVSGDAGASDRYPLLRGSNTPEAPVILTVDVKNAFVGLPYMVKYSASDDDSPEEDLEWAMSTNGRWLTFTSLEVLKGTPSINDTGSCFVNISVSDGALSDWTNFTVTVKINGSGPGDEFEGHTFFFNEDSENEGLDSADLFPGADGTPDISVEGAEQIEVKLEADGKIRFIPAPEWSGSEIIDITASLGGWIRTVRVIVNIVPVNDPPRNVSFTSSYLRSGDRPVICFNGRSQDADIPYGDRLTYIWYIDGFGIVGHGEAFTTELPPGEYNITMRVADLHGSFVDVTEAIEIGPAAIEGPEGDMLEGMMWTIALISSAVLFIILTIFLTLAVIVWKKGHGRGPAVPQYDQVSGPQTGSFLSGPDMDTGSISRGSLDSIPRTDHKGEVGSVPGTDPFDPFLEDLQVEALVMTPPPGHGNMEDTILRLNTMRGEGRITDDTYRKIRSELDGYS